MTHTVILFELDTRVLLTAIEIIVKGTHTRFMRKITVKQAQRKVAGRWSTPAVE